MKNIYLDTNIFLYLQDQTAPQHKECKTFIEKALNKQIILSTSTETIQEIIHYAINTKQKEKGTELAKLSMKLVDNLISIDQETMEIYIEQAEKYTNIKSRDLIHSATCIQNRIDILATYDHEFNKIKEIKAKKPAEIIENMLQ